MHPHRRRRLASILNTAALLNAVRTGLIHTHRGHYEQNSGATIYTFDNAAAGIPIGPSAADRIVCVEAWCRSGGSVTLTAKFNGASANILCGTTDSRGLWAFWLLVPTGETLSVEITGSAAMTRCGVSVRTLRGGLTSGYHARSGVGPNSNNPVNLLAASAIEVPAGGIGIAAAWVEQTGGAVVWSQSAGTGATDFDFQLGTSMRGSTHTSRAADGAMVFTADGADGTHYRVLAYSWAKA